MGKGLWINSKVIKPEDNRDHRTKYCTYIEDGDDVTVSKNPNKDFKSIKWSSNAICFANLMYELRRSNDVNRVMYYIQDSDYKNKLDDQEKADWVAVAKRGLVLPDYVTEEIVLGGTPVIKLVDINPSLLYTYLSSLRVIQENPSFVRAMIYLVAVYRMNFCAAWAVASKLVITNSWHNIIEISRGYGQKVTDDVNDIEVVMGPIIGLQRYIKDPWRYDKRKLTDKNAHPFNVNTTIQGLCHITTTVKAGDLFAPCVLKAIDTKTDKEAMNYLNEL